MCVAAGDYEDVSYLLFSHFPPDWWWGEGRGVINADVSNSAPPIGGDPAADHKKLVDDKYKRIGCAFTRGPDVNGYWGQGLWVCDLKGE